MALFLLHLVLPSGIFYLDFQLAFLYKAKLQESVEIIECFEGGINLKGCHVMTSRVAGLYGPSLQLPAIMCGLKKKSEELGELYQSCKRKLNT